MEAAREKPPIDPGPEPDTSTAAEGELSDPTLDREDDPVE